MPKLLVGLDNHLVFTCTVLTKLATFVSHQNVAVTVRLTFTSATKQQVKGRT